MTLHHWGKWIFGAMPLLFSVMFSFVSLAHADSVCPFTWTRNLTVGTRSSDVLALQRFLNENPGTTIASQGVGSPGEETMFFGSATSRAVAAFQQQYASDILTPNGLTSGSGFFGASTRAKLNALCAKSSATSASTNISSMSQTASVAAASSAPALTVAAADQPAPTLAVQNALYVPFTRVTLTAGATDVTVNSITISRQGPSRDSVFSDAELLDNDGNVMSTAYFHTDHTATFTDSFTVPAGTSIILTIAGDMAADLSDDNGEAAVLSLDAINASAAVTGTLPIRGTSQTMNSTLAIGTASATLSAYNPDDGTTRYIQDTNVKFAGIRISADSAEAIELDSIAWRQAGSASGSDITNVRVVVNGTAYPAEVSDRYYTATFPGGIVIPKGNTTDAYIEGDIGTTGANRTVKFDIGLNSDITLKSMTYGYYLWIVPGGNTDTSGNSVFLTDTGDTSGNSLRPFFSGPEITISGGAVNGVSKI